MRALGKLNNWIFGTLLISIGTILFLLIRSETPNYVLWYISWLFPLVILRMLRLPIKIQEVVHYFSSVFTMAYIFIIFPALVSIPLLVAFATLGNLVFIPKSIRPNIIWYQNHGPFLALSLAAAKTTLYMLRIDATVISIEALGDPVIGVFLIAIILVQNLYQLHRREMPYDKIRSKIAIEEKNWTLDVLSLLSHNIRTPLTSLSHRIEIMKLKLDRNTPIGNDEIERLEENNDEIQSIVHQLLSTTARNSISENKSVIIQLNNILERINSKAIVQNPYFIDFYLSTTMAISLELCIDSLVSNSVKYGGKDIHVRVEDEFDQYIIKVSDDGQGMTESQLSLYGTPFNKTKSKGGTGLGVYFTLNIMKELGWTWEAHSELGKGTTVSIKIPKDTLAL